MKELAQPVEHTLYAKLYVAGGPVAIELHRMRGDEQVPPGGYATEDYTFKVPTNVSGDAVLSFSDDGQGYRVQLGQSAGTGPR